MPPISAPQEDKSRAGDRARRRRYVTRSARADMELAVAIGTRVHRTWVSLMDSDLPSTEWEVVMAIAYHQDMVGAGARGEPVASVYPEDVADALGMTRERAAAYLGRVMRKGYLIGSANAGYNLKD